MEDEAVVAAFMKATGCGREDAFDRLASCGGHLGRAINSFFSIDAGPSSGRRRRPRSPPSSDDEEDAGVRARPVVPARRPRVSRWDSETKVVVARSKSSRRRERRRRSRHGDDRSRGTGSGTADTTPGGGDRQADADADGNRSRRRRFREFREDIFSDGEDEEDNKETGNNRRRRRLNPTELTSEGETKKAAAAAADDDNSRHRVREDAIIVSSSSSSDEDNNDMLAELDEAPRPEPAARNRAFEDLYKVPHELTFKGGFHAAKAQAARQARWLLANVQSFELPLPSLHQNRDVWGNALVARCVSDRFVLWQADAGAADDYDADGGGQEEEAKKVLGYYGIPHDMLPVVVVVDPVTGQAMDVLHGSAACELNDFMVRLGPYTETKPDIPVVMAKKSTTSASAGAQQSSTRPATTPSTTIAPTTTSEHATVGSRQPQATAPTTTTVRRKHQPDAVVAAVSVAPPTTCQARQEQAVMTTTVTEPAAAPCAGQPQPESVAEETVCKVRVRLADGRVVTKEFGSQCAVAALFAYCRRSMLDAGATPEKPFRLLRFVGRATEEIGDESASFESLGLHLTTVSVQLG